MEGGGAFNHQKKSFSSNQILLNSFIHPTMTFKLLGAPSCDNLGTQIGECAYALGNTESSNWNDFSPLTRVLQN